ncbi:MAG: POTRA domain-containing protein [Pyrinomonadaceae bacterium]
MTSVARAAGVPDLSRYEGRTIAATAVVLEGVPRDARTESELAALLTIAPNTKFAATRVRESLQALFDSGRVANARVEAVEEGAGLRLRFVVRPAVRVGDVVLNLTGAPPGGGTVSTDELRARLNLMEPGARVSEQALRNNADLLQSYLRDHGFYQSDVTYAQTLDASGTRATVTYNVALGPQAHVDTFTLRITGFDPADEARVRSALKLQPGAPFTRTALGEDITSIRQAIIAKGFLAPQLGEPKIVRDPDKNAITIDLKVSVGPRVNVNIAGYDVGDKTARELLPVKREGSIDLSAIVEGQRRLRNRLQEEGFFFADVTHACSVSPGATTPGAPGSTVTSTPAPPSASAPTANTSGATTTTTTTTTTSGAMPPAANAPIDASTSASAAALQNISNLLNTEPDTCELLDPEQLSGRTVDINYTVERGRRFRLTDIRIINADTNGPAKLSYDDLADDLRSETSGLLSVLPFIGKAGRGYTSRDILVQDQHTVEARYKDLGYRRAHADVRQGVSLNSDDLIITFAVHEGPLTRVAGVDVRGNQIYTAKQLQDEPCKAAGLRGEGCTIIGAPYARTLARNDADRLRNLYARNGYADADVRVDVVELPKNESGDEQVRLVYNVTEGGKVFINHIIINGNETAAPNVKSHNTCNLRTKCEAILEAIPLKPGAVLRADDLAESERVLYETNAFRQVIIRTQPATETAAGFRTRDVIIDLEELKPRRQDYIFGFSTDGGPLGGYELQHNNLRGLLQQGAIRFRANRPHQLLRFEFFDPRFRSYSKSKFSPLAASLQYSRDVSVTRFFRSTIDRGSFGIVQRLDEKGNPIDIFGNRTGEPTINRFTFNIESQRVLNARARTILFVRYNYEDVRLFKIGSLLVEPILQPDKAVRLSRFGATITRDTRDRQFDPTRGEFLTTDYALALRQLGGNLSFGKLLLTYYRYYRLGGSSDKTRTQTPVLFERKNEPNGIKGTVFALGFTLGAANVFNPRDRDGVPGISDVDRTLPISERFFSGGSTTLRGFSFEEAGPRRVICPGTRVGDNCMPSIFRDLKGNPVRLNPFTVPVGGNALAVLNLEARVPLTRIFQIVPFYDGGNVFRQIGDIFKKNKLQPSDTLDQRNLRAQWTHTVGLGLRLRTPFGPLAVDYAYLLDPPTFEIPQFAGPPAILRLKRTQIHFRFGQSF